MNLLPSQLATTMDVTDLKSVKDCCQSLLAQWPKIDVLVNNIGISEALPLALIDE